MKKIIKYIGLIVFFCLTVLVLLDFPGSSEKSYKFYCEEAKTFYESQIKNGIVVKNEIEDNNHGIRDLIISTSNDNLINIRIIGTLDWESVDKLIVGETVTKSENSFVVSRKNRKDLNILTYCDDYFKVN